MCCALATLGKKKKRTVLQVTENVSARHNQTDGLSEQSINNYKEMDVIIVQVHKPLIKKMNAHHFFSGAKSSYTGLQKCGGKSEDHISHPSPCSCMCRVHSEIGPELILDLYSEGLSDCGGHFSTANHCKNPFYARLLHASYIWIIS